MAIETVRPMPTPEDPFRYGWRHVRHEHPDGTETWERVPLTLEDVLHPQEEDFVAQSVSHQLSKNICTQSSLPAWLTTQPQ